MITAASDDKTNHAAEMPWGRLNWSEFLSAVNWQRSSSHHADFSLLFASTRTQNEDPPTPESLPPATVDVAEPAPPPSKTISQSPPLLVNDTESTTNPIPTKLAQPIASDAGTIDEKSASERSPALREIQQISPISREEPPIIESAAPAQAPINTNSDSKIEKEVRVQVEAESAPAESDVPKSSQNLAIPTTTELPADNDNKHTKRPQSAEHQKTTVNELAARRSITPAEAPHAPHREQRDSKSNLSQARRHLRRERDFNNAPIPEPDSTSTRPKDVIRRSVNIDSDEVDRLKRIIWRLLLENEELREELSYVNVTA